MSSWSEIEQIRKDPVGAKFLASRLLRYSADGLTDWEADFLASLERWPDDTELSTRQAEKLLQIRDAVERVAVWRGFNLRRLILRCHEARADLGEDDETWIEELVRSGSERIRRRQLARLIRCAKALHLVEGHMAA